MPIHYGAEFRRSQSGRVTALVILGGVQPDRSYEVSIRWFDPQGNLVKRLTMPLHIPSQFAPGYSADLWFHYAYSDASQIPLGRWRVELIINGMVEGETSFQVEEEIEDSTVRVGNNLWAFS